MVKFSWTTRYTQSLSALAEVCGSLTAKFWGQSLVAKKMREGGMRSCSWGRTHLENALQKRLATVAPNGPTNSSRTHSIAESATGGQPAGPVLKFSQQAEFQANLYKKGPLSRKSSVLFTFGISFPGASHDNTPPQGWRAGISSLKQGGYFSPSGQVKGFLKLSVAA